MAKKSTANPQVEEQKALKEQTPPTPDEMRAQQAIQDAAKPDPEAAAKPADNALTSDDNPASPATVPASVQPTVANIEEQRGLDEEKREQELTPTQRMDRLEAALGSGAGLNVRDFTDLAIHMDRNAIIAEAIVRASDVILSALREAAEGLTLKERLDRAEAALRSGKTLGNLI